jgi:hypothetical protein
MEGQGGNHLSRRVNSHGGELLTRREDSRGRRPLTGSVDARHDGLTGHAGVRCDDLIGRSSDLAGHVGSDLSPAVWTTSAFSAGTEREGESCRNGRGG